MPRQSRSISRDDTASLSGDDIIVDYDHERNREFHSIGGARAALEILIPKLRPNSVLDLGCGTGTWLRALLDLGVHDVMGADGAPLLRGAMQVPTEFILRADLRKPLDLGRRFDLVLCLETAEHLEHRYAETVIQTLTDHADQILFSAAAPGQPGQHHVNCQWPDYWQGLFNRVGFECSDWPRWLLWESSNIEPWYRQNLILARRNGIGAGKEPRIPPVIHPEMIPHLAWNFFQKNISIVEAGSLPWRWYLITPIKAALAKAARAFRSAT